MNFSISIHDLSIFEQIVAALFLLSAIIQMLYYLLVFSKLAFYTEDNKENTEHQPVSVIISAHNEDYNLQKNLPAILDQDYPDFEVVVVDDGSTDDTPGVLKKYETTEGFRHIRIENNSYRNPSVARNAAYREATGEIIIAQSDDMREDLITNSI